MNIVRGHSKRSHAGGGMVFYMIRFTFMAMAGCTHKVPEKRGLAKSSILSTKK